ncbi:MAG: ATP-dependent zinc protease [Hahellaceae bacterium]|nr:ATP-dependent zinc protease [Hahellaceae bacterium]MCP5170397.1 ATP-dependent zinc protease [Hahellaceae bacterium]
MQDKPLIGWREWVALPELNIPRIKAKVDTGARTSTLHAFDVTPFERDGQKMVRFSVHPEQQSLEYVVTCELPVLDCRAVTDSGGHREERYVVTTLLSLGESVWPIEMTLTNRDTMKFRMLLGRTAMRRRYIVDPAKSFLSGK